MNEGLIPWPIPGRLKVKEWLEPDGRIPPFKMLSGTSYASFFRWLKSVLVLKTSQLSDGDEAIGGSGGQIRPYLSSE